MSETRPLTEQALLQAVGEMQLGLTVTDITGRILFVNQADSRMHGFSPDELVGRDVRIFSSPELWQPMDGGRLSSATTWERESINVRKDGTTFRVRLLSDVVRDEAGDPLAIVTTCEDLSHRPRSNETTRWLTTAVATMQLGVTITDTKSRILFTNQADARMHGYEPEELIGKHIRVFAIPETRRPMEPRQIREISSWQRDSVNRRRDGTTFPVRLLSDAVLGLDGEPLGVVTTCEDITERKAAEEALRQSEEKYRAVVENIEDGYYETDRHGRITFSNDALARILGYRENELAGMALPDLTDSRGIRSSRRAGLRALRTEAPIRDLELAVVRNDGTRRHVEVSGSRITDAKGRVIGFRGIVRDVTDRKRAELALKASEERFRSLTEGAPVFIWISQPEESLGAFLEQRWMNATGQVMAEEIGGHWADAIDPEDLDGCAEAYGKAVATESAFRMEYRIRGASGEELWILDHGSPRSAPDGSFAGFVGSCLDISDRKRAELQTIQASLHDGLTGLPNRALFVDRLQRAIARSKRHPEYRFAVLFIDIDRFKLVNDSVGHVIGDEFLANIAHRLLQELRPSDTIARMGGDEFTILVDQLKDVADATRVAKRVQDQFAAPFEVGGKTIYSSASIGIALSDNGYDEAQEVLRDADTALYRAKALGKARHEIFGRAMQAEVVARLELETEIRHCIERRELRLAYQPIVSLTTHRIVSFEALLRWRHPTRGEISPEDFIPIAEEAGLILPIGHWVLAHACRQAASWRRINRSLSIAVNLSAVHFAHGELAKTVRDALVAAELDGAGLIVEITETAIVETPELAVRTLNELRALGVRVGIDDFGTGHSSLSALYRFPIDTLKIDRAFVARLGTDRQSSEIVRSIISMAHGLELDVVAEGIETLQQLAELRQLSCELGQGYLFARPLEAAEAGELLAGGAAVGSDALRPAPPPPARR